MRVPKARSAWVILGSLAMLFVLLVSSGAPAQGAGSTQDSNWSGPDNNFPLNWSYDNQTVINSQNVNQLQVKWTFPVPSAPVGQVQGAEGVMQTPLIYKGVIYGVTNWSRLYALNAENGQVVWYVDLPIMDNYSLYLQPSVPGPLGVPLGHYHALFLTTDIWNEALIWVVTNTYQVFALKATTGDIVLDFNPFVSDRQAGTISGSYGLYDVDTPDILIDQQRGVLMFSPSVTEGDSGGRGFLEAWNLATTAPKFMWRTYVIPPQDGSDPRWSLDSVMNMTHAYIFNGTAAVDLKALPQDQLNRMLVGDWGNFGFNKTISFAGGSAAWGGAWAIDEQTGVAYIGTNVPGPDWNATYRPGPDLWSGSVLALNITSGKMIWGFQAIPHALGDFDCSWNVMLANETINGQNTPVVYKGCKNGYVFALNADTGSMLWFLKPPSINYENVVPLNPMNSTQMDKYNWAGYPSTKPIVQNPSDTGALEADLAFDPSKNLVFAATYNEPKLFTYSDVGPPKTPENVTQWEFSWGVKILTIRPAGTVNSTIYAIDAANGQIRWNYTFPYLPYRGGLTVSGGVVYASTLDGTLHMLDEQTGKLLASRTVGGSLLIQPSLGSDANGGMTLVMTDMGSTRWGPPFPGFVQALTLPAGPQGGVTGGELLLAQAIAVAAVASVVVIGVAWARSARRRY
ncbi:MAG TPA: PQQ-binding-like beta-propeller repeat protein [Nitrososphaerales archaeon]|nr:PQQ-binding-like beta-propeller repeat protein [Nitrososphaerales archaeon]